MNNYIPYYGEEKIKKGYVFLDGDNYVFMSGLTGIAKINSEKAVENYADIYETWQKSPYSANQQLNIEKYEPDWIDKLPNIGDNIESKHFDAFIVFSKTGDEFTQLYIQPTIQSGYYDHTIRKYPVTDVKITITKIGTFLFKDNKISNWKENRQRYGANDSITVKEFKEREYFNFKTK